MTAPDSTRPAPSLWARLAARLGSGARDDARPRRSKEERDQDRLERRAQHSDAKRQADEAREARRREEAERREAERLEYERVLDAACGNYTRVRAWLTGLRSHAPAGAELGDAERRAAAALAPLWDADRATITTLRRWCDPLGGAPSPVVSEPSERLGERMRRQMTVLRKQSGGGDLLVPEVATLGRGGFTVGDQLHSEDSLNFAFAAAALKDAAVLSALRGPSRRVVWEIGGGWGGFAYHLKTMCPNVTYLVTGLPERLLVSAVYLMSVIPGVRVRLHGEAGAVDAWADWEQVDFVFAVEGTTSGMRPPRLDLTIDMNELRHMPAARATAHVARAFEWGSPYFYSVLPCPAADEPCSPWPAIERWYWPHPVPRFAERSTAYARTIPAEEDFAHLMGWRRLRA